MTNQRLYALVSGRVQGVSFRYYTQQMARSLKLTGWVRNLPDGRVEVTAEGGDEALRRLEAWLQHGSPAARVTEVVCRRLPGSGEFASFDLRW